MVQEKDSSWALPGGWCEVNLTPEENCIKETREEAGIEIEVERLIAIHESNRDKPLYPYGVCQIFFLCKPGNGHFSRNNETVGCKYFALDELPKLSDDKDSKEQVERCFAAYFDQNWQAKFD